MEIDPLLGLGEIETCEETSTSFTFALSEFCDNLHTPNKVKKVVNAYSIDFSSNRLNSPVSAL